MIKSFSFIVLTHFFQFNQLKTFFFLFFFYSVRAVAALPPQVCIIFLII